MVRSETEGKYLPRIAEFYHDKSIFMTGASGFIGSVLLEIILRCCPGVKSIYILLRSKKNIEPTVRKEEVFKKKIFDTLKKENQEVLKKVHVISGDITLPNLGIKDEDMQLLIDEVSIVFHCAANVQFTQPLKFMLESIVLSLNSVIELCRRLKKFEVLVYTSTAYSNCNYTDIILKEEVYRLPFRAEEFIEALKNEDNEKVEKLYSICKPAWPNTYTFSKCLAENLIMDTASDLSIAIIRPSIVINTCKTPVPGYEEGSTGVEKLCLAVGKGFVKVIRADPNCKLNLVPVDIVGNTHVLSACRAGIKGCASPLIINCTANENFHIKISEYLRTLIQIALKNPLPQSFSELTDCNAQPNKYLYYMFAIYHHYLPAIVFDVFLKISGGKSKAYSLYRFFDKLVSSYNFFVFHSFEFERNNMEVLNKLISPEDIKNLSLDFKDTTFEGASSKIPEVCSFYDWTQDKKSPSERQKIKHRRHVMITCIKNSFIFIIGLFISWLLFR